ncbi:MAG: hypothetical protein DWI02_05940 [Planctomycetota bacterium]|jgi:hypothetical protein|nr:MAG: hypothetical protein DWI02_05940 [Planctomycetota bacterium]
MSTSVNESVNLSTRILDRIEELILTAERETKPLELDPLRSELFELFVTANGAGYTNDDSDPDLSADGLCRTLGLRWGLADAAKSALDSSGRMPAAQLSKMRLLWSVMRMWMEWTYAWKRWPEFHREEAEIEG